VGVRQLRVVADTEVSDDVLTRIRRMVDAAFDGDFEAEDWQHTYGGYRVILFDGPDPISHAAVVPRQIHIADRAFRAGYIEGVATHPAQRRQGLASLVIEEATTVLRAHFELGVLSTGAPEFYRRFGWESWHGPSFVQHGEQLIRTLDEDDGLMVLRFGPSAAVDLAESIACEARCGDDW
jgi:aminoglycoside 2'-N-acetyltransferase I